MTGEAPRCLLSVHDVMPETFPRVEAILTRLALLGDPPVTLLVVPGRAWTPAQLARLRAWAAAGHTLAAHGWHHRVERLGGFGHWLHARLLSRAVAEHLALDSAGIAALMHRSAAWFGEHDLPAPRLYVPPAWALGRLRARDRAGLPFARVEVTRGLLEPVSGRLEVLPLIGFEADTAWRRGLLRGWNGWQVRRARRDGRPVRFSLHPDDFSLLLRDQLEALLARPWRFEAYPLD
jgi:uncharacterized protein